MFLAAADVDCWCVMDLASYICEAVRAPTPTSLCAYTHTHTHNALAHFPTRSALAPAPAGDLPHYPLLGINASVWSSMGPLAQATAMRAGVQRQQLAKFKVLTELGAPLPTAAALDFGVKVLRVGRANSVALGVFDLPRLDGDVVELPKGTSLDVMNALNAARAVLLRTFFSAFLLHRLLRSHGL